MLDGLILRSITTAQISDAESVLPQRGFHLIHRPPKKRFTIELYSKKCIHEMPTQIVSQWTPRKDWGRSEDPLGCAQKNALFRRLNLIDLAPQKTLKQ